MIPVYFIATKISSSVENCQCFIDNKLHIHFVGDKANSRYLSYPLKRMLRNTFIQPHHGCGCCSCYLNLSVSLKTKLQTIQNFCIKYCLGLKDGSHIRKNEFEKINWLPVSNRVGQCLAVTEYDCRMIFLQNIRVISTPYGFLQTREHVGQLAVLLYLVIKKEIARKSISYLGSKIWNDLNQDIKASPIANSFKHALKGHFLKSQYLKSNKD